MATWDLTLQDCHIFSGHFRTKRGNNLRPSHELNVAGYFASLCICSQFRILLVTNSIQTLYLWLAAMEKKRERSDADKIGRESAANQIVSEFTSRLVTIAKKRLGRRIQSKVSAEDIVQSALKSFFGRFDEFTLNPESPHELWGLLLVITLRKCAKWEDIFGAEKRDVRRERSLAGDSNQGTANPSRFGLRTSEPSPEEIAIFHDLLDHLLLPFNERQREMIRLRLDGLEVEEIATAVMSSKRTVARVMAAAKQLLRDAMER